MRDLNPDQRAKVEEAKRILADATKRAKKRRPKKFQPTEEGQRQPRVRNNGYLAFLRRQPCLNCGTLPCDPAHVRFAPSGSGWRYVGKAEKPDDARAVPLCRACHTEQHSMAEHRFWSEILKRDPVETCRALQHQFQRSE